MKNEIFSNRVLGEEEREGCDHITGFVLALRPAEDGDSDYLLRASSSRIEPDEPFNYCPLCGEVLRKTATDSSWSASPARKMSSEISRNSPTVVGFPRIFNLPRAE
jgi:hypothetical protein